MLNRFTCSHKIKIKRYNKVTALLVHLSLWKHSFDLSIFTGEIYFGIVLNVMKFNFITKFEHNMCELVLVSVIVAEILEGHGTHNQNLHFYFICTTCKHLHTVCETPFVINSTNHNVLCVFISFCREALVQLLSITNKTKAFSHIFITATWIDFSSTDSHGCNGLLWFVNYWHIFLKNWKTFVVITIQYHVLKHSIPENSNVWACNEHLKASPDGNNVSALTSFLAHICEIPSTQQKNILHTLRCR